MHSGLSGSCLVLRTSLDSQDVDGPEDVFDGDGGRGEGDRFSIMAYF